MLEFDWTRTVRALVTLSIVGGDMRALSIPATIAIVATLGACSSDYTDEVALATRCMRASDDNRVKLSSSWLSSAEIDVRGDLVTVRTEVPVGISIGGTVKFHYWTYRCRMAGERMEFLGYEAE
jgi:hypothetical protein